MDRRPGSFSQGNGLPLRDPCLYPRAMNQPIEIAFLVAAVILVLLITLLPHATHEGRDPSLVSAVPIDQSR